jgi:Zn-dependent peptidase ImmA (M78 family)
MTKVSLGRAVDLTARRIAEFENEGEAPPERTIVRFSEVLNFPPPFFYRPTISSPTPDTVSFRSFSKLPAGRRDAALAAAGLAIELGDWVDSRFRLPTPDLADVRDLDPAAAGAALRAAWALGDHPAPNMIHLLEAHGVRVFSLADDCRQLDAFSFWRDEVPFVFLARQKSPERGRWDAAHELAHLVLHLGAPPQGREQEADADAFAAEFLLPSNGVRASAARFPSLRDILEEKVTWEVSALAYTRRLHQLDLLTDWQYRSLVIEASTAGYRRSEGDIPAETSQIWTKVQAMLKDDTTNLFDISAELAVPVADLRELIFSPLSLIEGQGSGGPKTRHLTAL